MNEKRQPTNANAEIMQILDLFDKNFKTSIVNLVKDELWIILK